MLWLPGLLLLAAASVPALAVAQTGTIGMNFTGVTLADGMTLNSNNGYAPPDNGGGVSHNHIAQLINGAYAVYDKSTGSQQQLISAKQFWINAGVDPGNDIVNLGTFNERIIYDPTVDRWFAAGLSGQSTDNLVMIARSDTADPTGTWQAVSFLGNDGGAAKFADFTNFGIDADGVYVSTNNYPMNSQNVGFEYPMVFSIPKADLLAATPTAENMTQFGQSEFNLVGFSIQPVIDFGPSKGYTPLISILALPPGEIPLYRLSLEGTTGPGATMTEPIPIDVADYAAPPLAGQPDLTQSISTIDGRIASHAYQVGDTIYAVHNTSLAGNAALSVLILDEPSNQLIQEIVLGDPNFDYFNASIAANSLGDLVVGFTRSGLGEGGNLSAFAVVGHTANGVTTFGEPLLLKDGLVGNYHFANGRWGDYTTTVVDPSNPLVFWTFQEYALGANSWATQITSIAVPEPQSMIMAGLALAALIAAARRGRRTRGGTV
ncbi:MAG: PEP-CTERM sorting domain-containing protein [Pirellulales bacterium]